MKIEIREFKKEDNPVREAAIKFYDRKKMNFNAHPSYVKILVGFVDDRYLGFINFDGESIDIFLVPKMRFKGWGLHFLLLAERFLMKKDKDLTVINAQIINKQSASIFEKAGYIDDIADWYKVLR